MSDYDDLNFDFLDDDDSSFDDTDLIDYSLPSKNVATPAPRELPKFQAPAPTALSLNAYEPVANEEVWANPRQSSQSYRQCLNCKNPYVKTNAIRCNVCGSIGTWFPFEIFMLAILVIIVIFVASMAIYVYYQYYYMPDLISVAKNKQLSIF